MSHVVEHRLRHVVALCCVYHGVECGVDGEYDVGVVVPELSVDHDFGR